MNAPLYTTEILRLAASLDEPARLERIDGEAEVRSPTCGSRVAATVQLDDQRRVEALSLKVHACAFGQASAALAQRHAPGRNHAELEAALGELEAWLSGGQLPSLIDVEPLAPALGRSGRHGAILLPLRALVAAIGATQ